MKSLGTRINQNQFRKFLYIYIHTYARAKTIKVVKCKKLLEKSNLKLNKIQIQRASQSIRMKYGDIHVHPDGTLTREEKNRKLGQRENRAFLEYGISFREP